MGVGDEGEVRNPGSGSRLGRFRPISRGPCFEQGGSQGTGFGSGCAARDWYVTRGLKNAANNFTPVKGLFSLHFEVVFPEILP